MSKPFEGVLWFEKTICYGCRAPLDGARDAGIPVESFDESVPLTCYNLCGYCGAAYYSTVTLGDIAAGFKAKWERLPADKTPDEIKQQQAMIRRGGLRVPDGAKKWKPS